MYLFDLVYYFESDFKPASKHGVAFTTLREISHALKAETKPWRFDRGVGTCVGTGDSITLHFLTY